MLIRQLPPTEFVIVGFDATVSFRPSFGATVPRTDFVSVEEGYYEGAEWKVLRQLSGDEIYFGIQIPSAGTIVKVKVMKYGLAVVRRIKVLM